MWLVWARGWPTSHGVVGKIDRKGLAMAAAVRDRAGKDATFCCTSEMYAGVTDLVSVNKK